MSSKSGKTGMNSHKAPRHREKMIVKKNFVPGGENLLLDKSFASMI